MGRGSGSSLRGELLVFTPLPHFKVWKVPDRAPLDQRVSNFEMGGTGEMHIGRITRTYSCQKLVSRYFPLSMVDAYNIMLVNTVLP